MLETFKDTNEMLLASIRELTVEVEQVEIKTRALPKTSQADAGKILKINENGEIEAIYPPYVANPIVTVPNTTIQPGEEKSLTVNLSRSNTSSPQFPADLGSDGRVLVGVSLNGIRKGSTDLAGASGLKGVYCKPSVTDAYPLRFVAKIYNSTENAIDFDRIVVCAIIDYV